MRQSSLFTKTRRDDPRDEVAQNAKLLIRAGFVHKEMAGVYSLLPLGLRVLEKINKIIREEMDSLGAQELQLTALQNPEIWKATGRYEADVAFRTELKVGGELTLGWTHEEPITNLLKNHLESYRDLPLAIYQIQTKFRNEERAKSGVMRGREFLMKDLYSFHRNQEDLDRFYDEVMAVYSRIFSRIGLGDLTFCTFASGGSFSKYSHEFQTISEAGEDTIHLSTEQKIAVNSEVYEPEVLTQLGLSAENLEEKKAIEVGNIFKLGTRYSLPLGLNFKDESGNLGPVFMGCYGIGPTRLLGTIAEVLSDKKGLVWPEAIAPFKVSLVALSKAGTGEVKTAADSLYNQLLASGVEVLYDDRDLTPGEKFADADLFGLPYRVVVSEKSLASGGVEWKKRISEETELISPEEAIKRLSIK